MDEIQESVFAKIVRGEIPCYKIYEDEKALAFLDIMPEAVGHTLVIPKTAVEKVYDLPEEDYQAVMRVVRKLMRHYEEVLGKRMTMKVVGVDVPYAHVHILPMDEYLEESMKNAPTKRPELTEGEMKEVQGKLRLE